jgi:biopolymer transport protein ExbB/TolQ
MEHLNHLEFLGGFTTSGGDWVIYLLLAASVVAVTVIIERALVIHRRAREQGETLDKLAGEPIDATIEDVRKGLASGSVLERIAIDVQSHASKGPAIVEQQLETRLALERNVLEKRLLILGTLGNNAPFVGLLGTVLGVIRAFHDLGASANLGPEVIMTGLADALVSTAVGIIVALPCVASYNYLQRRINDLMIEADRFGHTLIAMLASEQ